ncbi:MAG: hypothetical protein JWN64_472 [Parcubacteria group bacterium]|nr:hypothetical protein [Parcubacteria group bacterium]
MFEIFPHPVHDLLGALPDIIRLAHLLAIVLLELPAVGLAEEMHGAHAESLDRFLDLGGGAFDRNVFTDGLPLVLIAFSQSSLPKYLWLPDWSQVQPYRAHTTQASKSLYIKVMASNEKSRCWPQVRVLAADSEVGELVGAVRAFQDFRLRRMAADGVDHGQLSRAISIMLRSGIESAPFRTNALRVVTQKIFLPLKMPRVSRHFSTLQYFV